MTKERTKPKPITRIWEGKLEWTETSYFQGQLYILQGDLKGMFINVTRKCTSYEKAWELLQDVMQSFLGGECERG